MPMRGPHAQVDGPLLHSSGFPSRGSHGNKENRALHSSLDMVSPRRTCARAQHNSLSLPSVHGTSAVLLPRNRSPRSTRSLSRLTSTSSESKTTTRPDTISPRTCAGDKRKLVLHFDARNTVLVADTVTQIGVKEAFNSYLTGVTWGREKKDGSWEWVSDIPSLTSPAPGAMTYYKHMEHQLVRTPSDRGHLRRVTGDFTQEALGERFYPYLRDGLRHIRWTHEHDHKQLVMVDKDGAKYHYLLPSVFRLIQHLQETGREFSIVLRTYGMDAPNILKALATGLEGKHPDFPNLRQLPVCHDIGHIERKENSIIVKSSFLDSGKHVFKDETEIYRKLSDTVGVCAFVDDFLYWQQHDYHHGTSKPHWIHTGDTRTQHIFFDDNLRVTDTDSIVDLRMLAENNNSVPSSVTDLQELQRFEDACLVQADLLESTRDLEYFVKKVELCETNYDAILTKSNISTSS